MQTQIAALAGALAVGGIILVLVGMRPAPERQQAAFTRRRSPLAARWRRLETRTRRLVVGGVTAGLLIGILTGWWIALVVIPAGVIGLPILLSAGGAARKIDRLEAMEEWARSLAGVLTVGVGLEQAIVATLRSTPKPIEPEVTLLAARLRARWPTRDAIRAFADDLDDPTGDLLCANLLLGAQRRGAGLASVLESVAQSVSEDVRGRRMVEADRAKPRATARWVTLITIAVLLFLFFATSYVDPYRSGIGQVILAVLLSAYVGCLVWMRAMARGQELPRFIGTDVAEEVR